MLLIMAIIILLQTFVKIENSWKAFIFYHRLRYARNLMHEIFCMCILYLVCCRTWYTQYVIQHLLRQSIRYFYHLRTTAGEIWIAIAPVWRYWRYKLQCLTIGSIVEIHLFFFLFFLLILSTLSLVILHPWIRTCFWPYAD